MSVADPRRRLLFAQTTLLGLFLGFLVVPASSVFLGEFGADQLPWTYIAVAVGAIVGTPALARGVRRRTLADIGVPLWSTIGAVVAAFKQAGPERRLELAGLTPTVEKVFKLTRMDSVFTIHAAVGDVTGLVANAS